MLGVSDFINQNGFGRMCLQSGFVMTRKQFQRLRMGGADAQLLCDLHCLQRRLRGVHAVAAAVAVGLEIVKTRHGVRLQR